MAILFVLCGLPGSGKSTLAADLDASENAVTICPDQIRKELTGSEEDQSRNRDVFVTAYKRAKEALQSGKSVIFDATNTSVFARERLLSELSGCYAKVVAYAKYVPLGTCLERNAKRERKVPESVIRRMYYQYEIPSPAEGFSEIHIIQ